MLAQRLFDAKRRSLVASGAWWDHPSVVARLKERMLARAAKVADLYEVWMLCQEGVAMGCIVDTEAALEKTETELEEEIKALKLQHAQCLKKLADAREKQDEAIAKYVTVLEERADVSAEQSHEQHKRKLWLAGIL